MGFYTSRLLSAESINHAGEAARVWPQESKTFPPDAECMTKSHSPNQWLSWYVCCGGGLDPFDRPLRQAVVTLGGNPIMIVSKGL